MTDLYDSIASEPDAEKPRGMGDNSPPGPTPIERGAALVEAANAWISEVKEIDSEDRAGKAQGLWDQLRAARDDTEAAKAAERKPLNDALKAITEKYATPIALVELAYKTMGDLLTGWAKKKQAAAQLEVARRQEEADRAAREAEELARLAQETLKKGGDVIGTAVAAAAGAERADEALRTVAKPAPSAAIKGDYSARAVSLKKVWGARLKPGTDERSKRAIEKEVLNYFARDPEGRAAMVAACLVIATQRAKVSKNAEVAPPGLVYFFEERI